MKVSWISVLVFTLAATQFSFISQIHAEEKNLFYLNPGAVFQDSRFKISFQVPGRTRVQIFPENNSYSIELISLDRPTYFVLIKSIPFRKDTGKGFDQWLLPCKAPEEMGSTWKIQTGCEIKEDGETRWRQFYIQRKGETLHLILISFLVQSRSGFKFPEYKRALDFFLSSLSIKE